MVVYNFRFLLSTLTTWEDSPLIIGTRYQLLNWFFPVLDFNFKDRLSRLFNLSNKVPRNCFQCMLYFRVPNEIQKQPPRGFLKKRCSENVQQIDRGTLMPKCDFNKFAKQLYWNCTSAWVFSCKIPAYFQNTFS